MSEKRQRRSVDWVRTEYKYPDGRKNLEKIFHDKWNKENEPRPGLNNGVGAAQELFIVPEAIAETFDGPHRDDTTLFGLFFGKQVSVYNLTEREQIIILTAMQWLGTNCGFAFLQECLREGGYRLVSTARDKYWQDQMAKVHERFETLKSLKGRFGIAVRKKKKECLNAEMDEIRHAQDTEEVRV